MFVIIETVENYERYPERITRLVGAFDNLRDAEAMRSQLAGKAIIERRELEAIEPSDVTPEHLEYEDYMDYRWYIFDTEDTSIEYRIA